MVTKKKNKMRGLQKLQEERQKQEEIISTSLACLMNNWIYIEVFEAAGLRSFWSYFFSLVTGFEEWQVKQKDRPKGWDGFHLGQARAVYK